MRLADCRFRDDDLGHNHIVDLDMQIEQIGQGSTASVQKHNLFLLPLPLQASKRHPRSAQCALLRWLHAIALYCDRHGADAGLS